MTSTACPATQEVVYKGHDNTVDLVLKRRGVAYGLSAVTKITASFDTTLVESTDKAAGPIKWDQAGYETGEIRLDVGGQAITAGTYSVPIVIYDATWTNGVVWGFVSIVVKDDPEAS